MSAPTSRLPLSFFRVHGVDLHRTAKAILTGERAQDERRLALLLAAVNAVNSVADMGRISARVLDLAVDLTGADRGILILVDEEGQLTVELARDASQQDLPRALDYSRSIVDEVADSGVAACIVDTLEVSDWEMGRSVSDLELRAILCAPLLVREETTGVIYVDSRLSVREFSQADLEVFEALCQQLALTLENAWLNEAVLQKEREGAAAEVAQHMRERLLVPLVALEAQVMALRPNGLTGLEDVLSAIRHIQMALDAMEKQAIGAVSLSPPGRVEAPTFKWRL